MIMSDSIYIGIMCLIGVSYIGRLSVNISVAIFVEHGLSIGQISDKSRLSLRRVSAKTWLLLC